MVDYIIIGGFDETGKKEENMIRFICKSKFNETLRDDLKSDIIIRIIIFQMKIVILLKYWILIVIKTILFFIKMKLESKENF